MTTTTTAIPFPPLDAVLGHPRAEAHDALARLGWSPWATPIGLDAARRRLLNLDLSEPELAFHRAGAVAAVATLETDRQGRVTHLEVVAAEPVPPAAVAEALLGDPGDPHLGGGDEAREWIWGPESGLELAVAGEPVRLWISAERAYGDRLWLVASLVRRG